MTTISAPHCDCADCRAAHWIEDEPDLYTAHEVADAWVAGHDTGTQDAVRRLIVALRTWLTTDPDDPEEPVSEPVKDTS